MANTVSDEALVHGCTDQTWGYFQSLDFNYAVERKEHKNGSGQITAFSDSGHKWEVKGTYIWRPATSGAPTGQVGTGTAITVSVAAGHPLNGLDIYIQEASYREANEELRMVDFTGNVYPDLNT